MLASIAVGVGLIIVCVVLLTPLEPVPIEPTSTLLAVEKKPLSDRDPASPVHRRNVLPESDDNLTVEKLQSEMVQVATRLTTEFSTVSDALHVAAMTYAELKQTQNAENVWRACIELKPAEVGPYVGLATNLIQRGQQAEAIKILNELRKSKTSGELYCELANWIVPEKFYERGSLLIHRTLRCGCNRDLSKANLAISILRNSPFEKRSSWVMDRAPLQMLS